jgi:hypothetical protein
MATSNLPPVPYEQEPIDPRTRKITASWQRWLNGLKQRAEEAVAAATGTIDASQIISGLIDVERIPEIVILVEFNDADFEHHLLDPVHHTDTASASPTNGELIIGQTNLWRPLAIGSAGQFLKVAAGLPAWSALAAGDIASGTLADARLSANVPLINAANVFTANQRVNAGLGVNVAPPATGAVALSGSVFDQGRSNAIGEKIDIAFSAGNFAGRGSMTWTVAAGDQETLSYAYLGKNLVLLSWAINTSTVGGTLNNWLQIQLPFTAATTSQGLARNASLVGGVVTSRVVLCSVTAGESLLKILNLDFSNFTAQTDTEYTFGSLPVWI